MKLVGITTLLGALAAGRVSAERTVVKMNPITQIVALLDGLAKKTEMEGKMEEELFNKFMCWGSNIVDTKTASNSAAQSRIESQEKYISDIENGRVEFTSERVDLEKELAEILADIDGGTEQRNRENKEFSDAKDEMDAAITALDGAIDVLNEATKNHTKGTAFLQGTLAETEGFAARSVRADALSRAADMGERVLSKGDALFLKRLLTGEVPQRADWKKLNRKATFKMSYKARSMKIQDVLIKMNSTFTENLADATKKEADALSEFTTLMSAKNAQKSTAEGALTRGDEENGAKGMNKEEAQDEVDALKQQVTDDEKFIAQTTTTLAEKKAEWKIRKTLRMEEVAAMSKAVAILTSDGARDNFKKSYKSQGYLLLQKAQQHQMSKMTAMHRVSAAAAISRAGQMTSDRRLVALAKRVAAGRSEFAAIVTSIDNMVTTLKAEENTTLVQKEACEKDRADNTRTAIKTSRIIDDRTDTINRLNQEISDIKDEIVEKQDTIKKNQDELADATTQRGEELREWTKSDADDKEAKSTINSAKDVLADFYKDNDLMFVQTQQKQPAGEAPPPPPATFDAPYGGKTAESKGVIAILEMFAEDVQKDITEAKAAEDAAATEFTTYKTETDAAILALNGDITTLNTTKGSKATEVSQKKVARSGSKDSLDTIMQTIADAKPGCDYVTINFPTKIKNLQVEMDGLSEAKGILSGASFSGGADPDREMKPGDAFLQKSKHA